MDAMILAAGLGTRLGALTDDTPKPLVEVAGETLLEHIARRLIAAGADRIIVNVHHLADQVVRFARERWALDAELVLSHERERLLGTGGGLSTPQRSFGVTPRSSSMSATSSPTPTSARSTMPIESGALATLAVHDRDTTRALLFDPQGLVGRDNRKEDWTRTARDPVGTSQRRPFAGIHVISPDLFDRFVETAPFDIIDVYLRGGDGARIAPYDIGASRWLEIGNPQRLERARRVLEG